MSSTPSLLDHPTRLDVLRRILEANPDAVTRFDRMCALASRALRAPVAQVNLVFPDRQVSVSSHGPEPWQGPRDVPIDFSFCQHVVRSGEPLRVEDAAEDERVRESPATTASGVVAYAAVPLTVARDVVVGSLCVVDFQPRPWSDDEVGLLEELAGFVVQTLEDRVLAQEDARSLAAMVEASEHPMIGATRSGIITTWNPAATRVFGHPPDAIVGRPLAELLPGHRRGRWADVLERIAAGESLRRNVRLLRRDGGSFMARVSASPLRDLAERVVGVAVVVDDLTERRRARQELSRSEARFHASVEGLMDAFGIYRALRDEAGEIVDFEVEYVNPAAERANGIPRERQVGGRLLDLLPGHAASGLLRHYRDVVEKGRPLQLHEYSFDDPDAAIPLTGVFDITAAPLGDGFAASWREVSDRREHLRALRESERRYRQLVDLSPDAIAVYRDERILFMNSAGARLLGAERPRDLVGRAISEFVHPESLPEVRERIGDLLRGAAAVPAIDVRFVRPDGTILFGETRASLVKFEGRPAVQVVVRDVTERRETLRAMRESEVRFRATFEQAAVGLLHVGPDLEVLRANGRIASLLGRPREALLACPVLDLVREDERPGLAASLASVAAQDVPFARWEGRMRRSDGGERWVLLTVSRVTESPDAPPYLVAVVEDETERREAEAALRRSDEQLRQAQKMEAVGRLAGGVAHDFNNLLAVIKGNVQLLLMDAEEESSAREHLEEVEGAADRAAGLTRQLLAFSRQQVLRPRVLDPNRALSEARGILARIIGEDVDLRWSLTPDLPAVHMDPVELSQVVMNLAVNARDAMPGGGVLEIATALERVQEPLETAYGARLPPGDYVSIVVRDTGHGIPEEVRPRVFEPFFTTKETGKGTGLGLSTVMGIVNQSGGCVRLDSGSGGTTFTVLLPRTDERPASGEEARAATALPEGGETILLAEDDAAVRRTVSRILRRCGYTVLTAAHGREALEVAERHREGIDMLVTDVVMPEMGGVELARRLRDLVPGLPVLYTSGHTGEHLRPEHEHEGVHFLQKPFAPMALADMIRRLLDASG